MSRDIRETVQATIGRMRERLIARLSVLFGDVTITGIDEITQAIDAITEAAGRNDTPALTHALHLIFGALIQFCEQCASVVTETQSKQSMGDSERQALALMLETARRDAQLAITERENELARLNEQLRHLESLVHGGGDRLVARMADVGRNTVARIDQLTTSASEALRRLQEIKLDAVRTLPDEKSGLDLEARTAELSARAAPILAHEFDLTAEDLATLEEILIDVARVEDDYRGLAEFIADWKRAVATIVRDALAWHTEWVETRQVIGAATILFPALTGETLVHFAGTTSETLDHKLKRCAELDTRLKTTVPVIQEALDKRDRILRDSLQRTTERRDELATIRERLRMPDFDALTDSEKRVAMGLTLCFAPATESISIPRLTHIIHIAGLVETMDEEAVAHIVSSLSLFKLRSGAVFKTYGLTEHGRHARERWRRSEPELLAEIMRGIEHAEHERQKEIEVEALARAEREAAARRDAEARAEEETRKVAARAARHAQAKAAKLNPITIKDKLTTIQHGIMQTARLLEKLPSPRDATAWARILAAGQIANLIDNVQPHRLARAYAELMIFDPPLFTPARDTTRQLTLVFSSVGQSVYGLFFLPLQRQIAEFEEIAGADRRFWNAPDIARRTQIERALIGEMQHIPHERFRTPPQE